MDDCVFCKIIKGEILTPVIDENDQVIVFLSLENHPLVVTKKHIENIYEMDESTGAAVMAEAIKIAKAVKKGMQADGVNLVQANEKAAKQTVMHFHLHIKPRWLNDGVNLDWDTSAVESDLQQKTVDKIKLAF